MKRVIHVNRHNVAANKKHNAGLPVFTVKTYKETKHGNRLVCHGPIEFMYTPDKPLSCGATVYAVTYDDIDLFE